MQDVSHLSSASGRSKASICIDVYEAFRRPRSLPVTPKVGMGYQGWAWRGRPTRLARPIRELVRILQNAFYFVLETRWQRR